MERTFKFTLNLNTQVPRRSVYSTIGFLVLGIFTYWQFSAYVIPGITTILLLEKTAPITMSTIAELMWAPIVGHVLIIGNVALLVRVFKPLKTEQGLGAGLNIGILAGLGMGALAGALSVGPVSLNMSLLVGILVGLLTSLIVGVGTGLSKELAGE